MRSFYIAFVPHFNWHQAILIVSTHSPMFKYNFVRFNHDLNSLEAATCPFRKGHLRSCFTPYASRPTHFGNFPGELARIPGAGPAVAWNWVTMRRWKLTNSPGHREASRESRSPVN